jgi:hypothetical protein
MFKTDQEVGEALAVPLFYGLVEAVILAIYCSISWKRGWTKAPKDENLCIVLTKTYEVSDDRPPDEGVSTTNEDVLEYGLDDKGSYHESSTAPSCQRSNNPRDRLDTDTTFSLGDDLASDSGEINYNTEDMLKRNKEFSNIATMAPLSEASDLEEGLDEVNVL